MNESLVSCFFWLTVYKAVSCSINSRWYTDDAACVWSSCVCGRLKIAHASRPDTSAMRVTYPDQRWSVARNTETAPTDAYGTIEFLGGPHPTKAQVRETVYMTEDCLCVDSWIFNVKR